jgi:hypothetical protein
MKLGLRIGIAELFARLAKRIAPTNPKTKREPFDVILSKEERHNTIGDTFASRAFNMRDVERPR